MPNDRMRNGGDLRRELEDWHDEEASVQIETIAAACALIAYADGVVRQSEHDGMAASLSCFGLIDEQSRQELLIEFEQATARFEIDPAVGEMAALSTIARLQGNSRFARTLFETCRLIGEADGHYIVEEQSALVKICRQLRLEPVRRGRHICRGPPDLKEAASVAWYSFSISPSASARSPRRSSGGLLVDSVCAGSAGWRISTRQT